MSNFVRPRQRWAAALFHPVDISSLVYFRVVFGALMLWEVTRYLGQDWVRNYWIEPGFHFTYWFFDWVKPWPGNGMIIHFYLLGALSVLIMLGVLYRVSAMLFFLGFSYVFLLEQARYLNHFYLISLISFLLIFVPAHHNFSIDSIARSHLRSQTTPAWSVWLIRFQIGVPYFFGGIAKLNGDWLQGEPMGLWLQTRTSLPLIGRFFTEKWLAYFFAYGGLLLDLFAVPLLLWRKTRPYMFVAILFFHLTNDQLFRIGIFPWFMIAATVIFFEPDWPRRLYHDLWPKLTRRGMLTVTGATIGALLGAWSHTQIMFIPLLAGATAGTLIAWTFGEPLATQPMGSARLEPSPAAPRRRAPRSATTGARPGAGNSPGWELTRAQTITLGLLLAWAVTQTIVPLRHYVIPGNASWTEEGRRFAWHMMLHQKDATLRFIVTNPADGSTWEIDPRGILTPRQLQKMSSTPHMIHQFARHLATRLEAQGHPDVEIRVRAKVSLNGRRPQPLIDPTVDLASQPVSIGRAPWILPLAEPLRRQ